jgi:hypothetical protein
LGVSAATVAAAEAKLREAEMAAGARAVSATPNQAEAETPETTVAAKSATESATESAAVEKLRAATAISSKPFDDYLLKSRWLPTTPQQRYNGAPQRSPSWSKMVTADEAPAAERAAAELAAAELAAAERAAAELAAAELAAAELAAAELAAAELAAAERVAATNPKIVKKRRTCSKRSSSPAEQQAAELAAAEKAAEETAEAERHAASKAAAVGLLQPEAAAVSASSKRSSSPIEQQFTNAASQLGGPQLAVRMTGEP